MTGLLTEAQQGQAAAALVREWQSFMDKNKRKAPSQGKDKNGGVYLTPLDFLNPVNKIFPIKWDLAADDENNVMRRLGYSGWHRRYLSATANAFNYPWAELPARGLGMEFLWLNPPFDNIEPWAKKCAEEGAAGAKILFLVPQGVQAWYTKHCRPNALELRLAGRLTFEGQPTPYPKDLTLFVFGLGMNGEAIWDWRKK